MQYGVDVDSINKPGFPFAAAVKAGYKNNYIKMGGGNLRGNAPYLMTSNGGYHGYVEQNRSAGAARTGHYWLTGGHDAEAHARFFLNNLDWRDGDFVVIDNEKLNAGNVWTDGEVYAFYQTLFADSSRGASIRKNCFLYGSQIGLFGSLQFPSAWRDGLKAIIALYNGQQNLPTAPSVPQANIKGHQFTSGGQVPGYARVVDMNVFADDAFAGGVSTGGASTGGSNASIGKNITSRPTADIQRLVGANPDGIYGADTTAKVKVWQKNHGLTPDGIWGPKSDAKGFPATSKPTTKAPAFPLPAGYYFGPRSGPAQSVSGMVAPYGGPNGSAGLKQWQQQMKNRGNAITVDGKYGDETARIAGNFQKQVGLTVDKLIGPATWAAAWTAPVTSQAL